LGGACGKDKPLIFMITLIALIFLISLAWYARIYKRRKTKEAPTGRNPSAQVAGLCEMMD